MRWSPLLLLTACAAGPPDGVAVGERAPTLSEVGLDGRVVSSDDPPDTPTVLVFWASWSGASRALAPALIEARGLLGDQVQWVGINAGEDATSAQARAPALGLAGPILSDRGGALQRQFGVPGVPYIVVLDAGGVVRHRGAGLPSDVPSLLDGPAG